MQYALVNNGYVVFGPTTWNTRIFNTVLKEDLNIDYRVDINQESSVPLTINETTKILPVNTVVTGSGSFGQDLAGPDWAITDTEAVATYIWVDKPLDLVKNELKLQVAADRWNKQNKFITVSINGTDVSVMPNKATKDELVSAIADGIASRNWKFANTWLTVDNAALQTVIDAIAQHVQTQFDWEVQKVAEIDSKTDKSGLETFYSNYLRELNPPLETPTQE